MRQDQLALEQKKREAKGLVTRNEDGEVVEEEAKKKKPQQKLILCTCQTKYRVIKKACRKLDYRLNDDETLDWDLYWADTGIQPQRIQKMQSYQRINH